MYSTSNHTYNNGRIKGCPWGSKGSEDAMQRRLTDRQTERLAYCQTEVSRLISTPKGTLIGVMALISP